MSGLPDCHAGTPADYRRARLAGAAWMLLGASCIGIVDGIAKYLFALFNIATRMLGGFDRPLTTVLYTFVVSAALVSLALPFVWVAPTAPQWLLFAASGLLGFAAHFSIARSLTLADASAVAPLHYVRIVWAIGIGLVIFGHVPDAWTLAGSALIVASGLYVVGAGPRAVAC